MMAPSMKFVKGPFADENERHGRAVHLATHRCGKWRRRTEFFEL